MARPLLGILVCCPPRKLEIYIGTVHDSPRFKDVISLNTEQQVQRRHTRHCEASPGPGLEASSVGLGLDYHETQTLER
jgi:hypothetical protein